MTLLSAAAPTRAQTTVAEDPCVFSLAANTPFTPSAGPEARPRRLPAGTRVTFLAARHAAIDDGALRVRARVRVDPRGDTGFIDLPAGPVRRCQDGRAATPDVREQARVRVDGVDEVWRLRFVTPSRATPLPPPEERTCADRYDAGFDAGEVVLERLRDGVVVDALTHIAGEHPVALRAPWQLYGADHGSPERDLGNPWRTLLDVGDYNHDGDATEFVVDLEHIACGHNSSAVVGVTRRNPHLHVLEWTNGGEMRLPNGGHLWEAVRASARGERVSWPCGDHGAPEAETLRWSPAPGGLRASTQVRSCPSPRGLTARARRHAR